jgi:hypothetical protein
VAAQVAASQEGLSSMKHVGAFMFHFHTRFHLSCCIDSLLFVAVKDEAKYRV